MRTVLTRMCQSTRQISEYVTKATKSQLSCISKCSFTEEWITLLQVLNRTNGRLSLQRLISLDPGLASQMFWTTCAALNDYCQRVFCFSKQPRHIQSLIRDEELLYELYGLTFIMHTTSCACNCLSSVSGGVDILTICCLLPISSREQ